MQARGTTLLRATWCSAWRRSAPSADQPRSSADSPTTERDQPQRHSAPRWQPAWKVTARAKALIGSGLSWAKGKQQPGTPREPPPEKETDEWVRSPEYCRTIVEDDLEMSEHQAEELGIHMRQCCGRKMIYL